MPEFFPTLVADVLAPLGTPRGRLTLFFNLTGIALVVAASIVRTMVPLRTLTVCSNVMLLVGAGLTPEPAHVILYLVLIPLNSYRLAEVRRLTRSVAAASCDGDLSGLWLKPYMVTCKRPAGTVVFHKGDRADSIYLLVEGELEWVELGKLQPAGEIFGEISLFSPDKVRTLTARCRTDCLILSIAEPVFKQLYFQHPKLAFQISSLIAHRLSADIQRLRHRVRDLEQLEQARPGVPTALGQGQTA